MMTEHKVPEEVREAIALLTTPDFAAIVITALEFCNHNLPAPSRIALAAVLCEGTGSVVVPREAPMMLEKLARDALAERNGEVVALREALEAVDGGITLEGQLQEIVSTALTDTAPSAARIVAEIKATALPTEGQVIQATLRAFDTSASFSYQHDFAEHVGKTIFAAIMAAAPCAAIVAEIRAQVFKEAAAIIRTPDAPNAGET